MPFLRALLFICLAFTQSTYARTLPNQCSMIHVYNNSEEILDVRGVYPDTKETLKSMILESNTTQQNIPLRTLRTCGGNTDKIHCHAVWMVCHKDINLTVTLPDTDMLLFSGVMHEGDSLSVNPCPTCDEPFVVLINDIEQ
jgi:hypothetical protein